MVLRITKHPDGYTAIVTPPSSDVEWATPGPMDERSLRNALHELGCHMIDVSDAFAAADPDIRREYQEASHRSLVERVGEEEAARIEKKVAEELKQQEERGRRHKEDPRAGWREAEENLREHFSPEETERHLKAMREYVEQQKEYARRYKEFIERLKKSGYQYLSGNE